MSTRVLQCSSRNLSELVAGMMAIWLPHTNATGGRRHTHSAPVSRTSDSCYFFDEGRNQWAGKSTYRTGNARGNSRLSGAVGRVNGWQPSCQAPGTSGFQRWELDPAEPRGQAQSSGSFGGTDPARPHRTGSRECSSATGIGRRETGCRNTKKAAAFFARGSR